MENDILIPLIARAIERILDVVAGITTIYFGYKLFEKAGTELSDLTASRGAWLFKLKNVGPGTLFALFGCLVIRYSLVNSFDISATVNQPGTSRSDSVKSVSLHAMGATGSEANSNPHAPEIDAINAINEITHFADLKRFPSSDNEIRDFETAVETLKELRYKYVEGIYTKEVLLKWTDWHRQAVANSGFVENLSNKDQVIYKQIDEALDAH